MDDHVDDRAAKAGFTLLEVLVALVVLSFLILGLYRALQFGVTGWAVQSRLGLGQGDLESVDHVVRYIIENIRPQSGSGSWALDGTSSTLRGVTALPVSDGDGEAVPVDVALSVSKDSLLLVWRRHRHAQMLGEEQATVVTLEHGVRRMDLAYWDPAAGWLSQWSNDAPPALVRLRLTFAAPDHARWPDIVAAPLLAAP